MKECIYFYIGVLVGVWKIILTDPSWVHYPVSSLAKKDRKEHKEQTHNKYIKASNKNEKDRYKSTWGNSCFFNVMNNWTCGWI